LESKEEIIGSPAVCRTLLELYGSIRNAVVAGAPAGMLHHYTDRMRAVEGRATGRGAGVPHADEPAGAGMDPQAARDLLEYTLAENRRIRRHVETAMAVAADEIKRLRCTRQVLGGSAGRGAVRGRHIDIRSA